MVAPAAAVNEALDAFNGIVTLAGTDKAGTLESNPTATEPLVAAALRLTLHVVVPPEDSEFGAHAMEDTDRAGVTKMLPPVDDSVTG
jgi:hypothetical protein